MKTTRKEIPSYIELPFGWNKWDLEELTDEEYNKFVDDLMDDYEMKEETPVMSLWEIEQEEYYYAITH